MRYIAVLNVRLYFNSEAVVFKLINLVYEKMKEFKAVLCTLIIVGLLFVIGYIYYYLIINFGVGGLICGISGTILTMIIFTEFYIYFKNK